MINLIYKISAIISFSILSLNISSHHAFTAEFDANAPINITGKVLKVEWINPHAWVHVEVEEKGKKTTWMVEGGTPNPFNNNRFYFDVSYRVFTFLCYSNKKLSKSIL